MQQISQHKHTSLDTVRINFMDACYALHQSHSETQKRSNAKKRFEARRAIEERQEEKQLQEALKDWWDDI